MKDLISLLLLREKLVIICLGNELRGDDASGIFLCRKLEGLGIGSKIYYAYTSPESVVGLLYEIKPEAILFIDAIDAGLKPGTIIFKRLEYEEDEEWLLTSHNIPVKMLIKLLRNICRNIFFLGIQVKDTDFKMELSGDLKVALQIFWKESIEKLKQYNGKM